MTTQRVYQFEYSFISKTLINIDSFCFAGQLSAWFSAVIPGRQPGAACFSGLEPGETSHDFLPPSRLPGKTIEKKKQHSKSTHLLLLLKNSPTFVFSCVD